MSNYKAKVVEVYSERILTNGKIDRAVASKMLEAGLDNLSPGGIGYDLLGEMFSQGQTIGIKVNTLAGRRMSTSPELVYSLAEILHKIGHHKENIIIWDRSERELKSAGYQVKTGESDFLCFATDTSGAGFSRQLYKHKSIGSLISKIQAEMVDSVINFPILKDHSLAGLSGCLKNYYGAIHNPNKYHENLCDPYQADLFALDVIGGKQRLAVFDAIRIQYNGGPGFVGRWAEEYKTIVMSSDAVALDVIGVEIIDRQRTKRGLKRLKESGREPVGLHRAGKDGLGCADLNDIEWVTIEV
ncbi:MAG: DUF362 domain-containing protein [candidate division Zixibacteria bacterium]|nr:DUF362 domain-containing protein [candidate division Zixibacteria bacterium]